MVSEDRKQLILVRLVNLLHFSNGAVLLPFLPLYLFAQGFNGIQVGLIIGVGPLIGIFSQPLWGYVSDRFQSVKYLLYLLYFLSFLASIGLFFTDTFILVFLSSILLFFSKAPCNPLIDSYTLSIIKQSGKGSYGAIRLWGSLGFAITAAVAGPVLVLIGIGNLYILYWIMLLAIYPVLFQMKDRSQERKEKVPFNALGGLLRQKKLIVFLLILLLIAIPNKMNDSMLGVHLQNLGATESLIGLAWMFSALSEIPVFYYLSKNFHRFNPIKLLGVVAFFYSVRWLSYSLAESPTAIAFLQLSHSITFGAFWIIAVLTVAKLVPDHLRSSGQALMAVSLGGAATVIGSASGGAIIDSYGGQTMYLVMSIFAFVAAVVIFSFRKMFTEEKETTKREMA